MKILSTIILGAAVLGIGASPTAGQGIAAPADQGAGWLAWYGCWRSAGEPSAPGETVCVLPGDDALSARFATIEDGRIAQESTIHADGVARPVEEGGCSGTQSAFFSADGRRVFTRSDLTCSNAPRVTTGVLAFVASDRWVDSQALTVRDQHAARSVTYEAASTGGVPEEVAAAIPGTLRLAQEVARLDASAPLPVAALLEAVPHLSAPALEGYLTASRQRFDLDAAALQLLRNGGVAPSTIDVIVAVSYPERFAVRPRDQAESPVRTAAMRDLWLQDYCYDPFWSGRFNDCYAGFGSYSRYSRFGYSPWGYDPYGWRYSRDPIFVVIEPGGEQDGGGTVDRSRGYVPGNASPTGTATPRNAGGSSETSRPSSSPSTSSGPTRSSGPSSSGGYTPSSDSGSGSTRTARPRGSSE